jgi:hypothetical protein
LKRAPGIVIIAGLIHACAAFVIPGSRAAHALRNDGAHRIPHFPIIGSACGVVAKIACLGIREDVSNPPHCTPELFRVTTSALSGWHLQITVRSSAALVVHRRRRSYTALPYTRQTL